MRDEPRERGCGEEWREHRNLLFILCYRRLVYTTAGVIESRERKRERLWGRRRERRN